jgi:chromosome segregation ATPase
LVPEEDVGSGILEDSMRYAAILGWLAFDQLATLNERIPTWGDGHFEGLRSNVVEGNKRIERLERNQEGLEEEVNRANDASYRRRLAMEARLDMVEERLVEARSAIHLANVEVRHLRGVVSRLSTRLAALEHSRENLILVENSKEDEREYPQLPVGDPGRLVEIEDVSEVESIFDEDAQLGSSISEARSSPVV